VFRQDRPAAGLPSNLSLIKTVNQRRGLEIFPLNPRPSDGMVTILSVIVSLLSFRFRRREQRARLMVTACDALQQALCKAYDLWCDERGLPRNGFGVTNAIPKRGGTASCSALDAYPLRLLKTRRGAA
jgi:hypothetical protein